MLKKIRVLFLGLVVLAGSACVTPTHASSASPVVLTYIQAAGPSGAKDELMVIHNNTGNEVEVTNWCIANKSSIIFACFEAADVADGAYRFFLPAYGYATIASRDYLGVRSLSESAVSVAFNPVSQSSGSIVSSADTILLLNEDRDVQDAHSWTVAPASGKAWARVLLLSQPDIYAANNDTADWGAISWIALPQSDLQIRFITSTPEPEEHGEGGEETPSELPAEIINPIVITEIFANAAGADAGKEFVELFNTSDEPVSLSGLRLRIGLETGKWFNLPADVTIPPLGYMSFSDTDLGFSLVNTSGGVQLYRGDEELSDRIEYTSPKEDMSWSLTENGWQYTATVTPGRANLVSPDEALSGDDEDVMEAKKACAANQFRNLETGRCKLISSTVTTTAACKVGQERNAETNRCRNIVAATSPTPCKEGQERNPETNRCRNITKMSDATHGVKGIQNKNDTQPSWYYWAGITGVVVLVLGYAVWEWREELLLLWRRVKAPFAKR